MAGPGNSDLGNPDLADAELEAAWFNGEKDFGFRPHIPLQGFCL